jgi:caa(3)-type oxidase subunit IV
MADHAHAHGDHGHDHGHGAGEHSHHPNYVRIWVILLVLLAISVTGPMLGIKLVTLMTAFGIAIVKAYLVLKNFMHIDIAARYVTYIVVTLLVFMFLFFAGAAPDVMKPSGRNWTKPSWVAGTAHPDVPAPGHEHEEEHGTH